MLMSWKCPQCGMVNDPKLDECAGGCGHFRMRRLVLTSLTTGKSLRVNVPTDIGRAGLQALAGEEAKFAASLQFRLNQRHGKTDWQIQHWPAAGNPTYLNGRPLDGKILPVKEGDVISIGPTKLKIKVSIELIA